MPYSSQKRRSPTRSTNTAQWRRGLLAKIHIGKKALGMSDDDYRALLNARYGVESSGKLAIMKLEDLVAYFEKLGVVFTNPGRRASKKNTDFYELPDGTRFVSQKRKIAAMWHALGWKMSGLDVRCAKQFGVDKFVWLDDQAALQKLVKDLHNRCTSRGIDPNDAQPTH